MVSLHSGTIAWAWTACSGATSTETPDAFQLRLGPNPGVYTYCSCYAASVTATSLRNILSTYGTYYGVVVASKDSTALGTSTEISFPVVGKSFSASPIL
jgi:hypothetical protein